MIYQPEDRQCLSKNFDEIKVGDEARLTHSITSEDIEVFSQLTGDYNPLHHDKEFARRTLFQKPIVHGMLSASYISTIIGMLLPGKGALWVSQTLEFLKPAYVGDTIKVVTTVKNISPSTKVLVLSTIIYNQNKRELITGISKVKLSQLIEKKKMKKTLKQTVLITGGSRGIGAATALLLASKGDSIIVNYVQGVNEANQLVDQIQQDGGKAYPVQADISNPDDVKRLFATAREQFGPIDQVVHGAATGSLLRPFDKLTWDDIAKQLDIQVKGAFHCFKEALPDMLKSGTGAIVVLGSIAIDNVPPAQQTDYVLAKAALTSFVKCLAVEYGPKGIRINLVAPGMTQTEMIASLPDKAKMMTQMQTPLRKLAEPDEIAQTIAFLLGPSSTHLTGETLRVCGGAMMI